MSKSNFDIKNFLTENKLTDASKKLDEGRGFDDVDELNNALKNINSAKDAENLLRTLWNGKQDDVLAKILLHAGNDKVYSALADAINDLVKKSPYEGPFDRMP